jgi:hypothetical protein
MRSRLLVRDETSAEAALTEARDMRSRDTRPTGTSGYAWRMVLRTSSSLDWVREARRRREGAWEAMLRAMVEPMDSGDTPVMRTGVVVREEFLQDENLR